MLVVEDKCMVWKVIVWGIYAVKGNLFRRRRMYPMEGGFVLYKGNMYHRRLCAVRGNCLPWKANLVELKASVCRRRRICVRAIKDMYGTLELIGPISMYAVLGAKNFVPFKKIWSLIEYVGR